MKALIVFESAHGCAEKCAVMLKDLLLYKTDIVRLKDDPEPDLSEYHVIIIGGSIHLGEINTRIRKFCEQQLETLKTKTLGLYICCMHEGKAALQQFEAGFGTGLIAHAKAGGIFGGEFDFSKMSVFEKMMIKKIANVEKTVSRIQKGEVEYFADKINKHYSSVPGTIHHKDIS